MLPAAPESGVGLRSWEEGPHPSSPHLLTAQNAQPEMAILVPPVHWAGLSPWHLWRGPRGAVCQLCIVLATGSGHSAGVWGSSLGQQLGRVSEGGYGVDGGEERQRSLASSILPRMQDSPSCCPTAAPRAHPTRPANPTGPNQNSFSVLILQQPWVASADDCGAIPSTTAGRSASLALLLHPTSHQVLLSPPLKSILPKP